LIQPVSLKEIHMAAANQAHGRGSQIVLADGAPPATLDVSLGNAFTTTLGGNRVITQFLNPIPGCSISYFLVQDATGSRTVTWPANVAWAAGVAPTLTVTAGKYDWLRFDYNEVLSKWMGFSVLNPS
jgi:hypothetical protein